VLLEIRLSVLVKLARAFVVTSPLSVFQERGYMLTEPFHFLHVHPWFSFLSARFGLRFGFRRSVLWTGLGLRSASQRRVGLRLRL
jgi:hypothetical protein